MAKMPFFQFYPHDWLYDTRICTDAEARTLIDLLCFMWNAPKRGVLTGHPQDLARMLGKEWLDFSAILTSLNRKKIVDVTFGNDEVTVVSRRMVRDENARESGRIRKRRHDNKDEERPGNAKVTDKKSEDRRHTPIVPFTEFYDLYPKKQARADAEKAWGDAFSKNILTEQLWKEKVRPALLRQRDLEDWSKDDGKFVPFPATWIRRRRWEDELNPAVRVAAVIG